VSVSRRVALPPYTFWETRDGAGSPIVLLHGLGGSTEWWRHNFGVLARTHLVSAIDLVGFGRNRFFLRRSRLPLRFHEIAALLGRWIESAFDEPVHLVGNSMGGHIAIHVAAHRPDVIRSLTLVDSTGIPFAADPRAHLKALAVPRGMLSFAQILARDLFRAGPGSLAIALARLMRDDARPLLRALRMPVLLLWGESDPLVPLKYARAMNEIIPGSRLVVIPDAGHIPMWENPEVFNRELLSFIDSVGVAQAFQPASFSWDIAGWNDGIAHRAAYRRHNVVLIHGLGLSSAYFVRFARALHAHGWSPAAPDLPGFGESANAPSAGPREHAEILAKWADTLTIRNAVWIGHSIGCNAVAHLAGVRPDLVRRAVCIGPLWSPRHSMQRLAWDLLRDAFREPAALWPYIVRGYWRCGLARWLATFAKYASDSRGAPPRDALMVAGARDPLVDRAAIRDLRTVPGAHAAHFSHPDALVRLAAEDSPEERFHRHADDEDQQRERPGDQ
jgi:pimeloyl-ACP methyl ester carboxylesterase